LSPIRSEVTARRRRSGPQKQGIVGARGGTGYRATNFPWGAKRFRILAETPALQ
jgi:hypothetical protein